MEKLVFVESTSTYKNPVTPRILIVRGKRFPVKTILKRAKIQSVQPPSTTHLYFQMQLEDGQVVEVFLDETRGEWFLKNYESFRLDASSTG
jgi:hypothetical protein